MSAPQRGVRSRWPLAVAVGAAAAAGLAVTLATLAVPGQRDAGALDLFWLVCWLSFALVGALILAQRPGHAPARALLAIGTVVPLAGLVDVLTFLVAERTGDDDIAVAYLRLAQDVLFSAGFALLLASVVLLPDGRLAKAWMRWPARAGFVSVAGLVLVAVLDPGPIGEGLPVANPLGLDRAAGLLDAVDGVLTLVLLVSALTGVLSILLRTRGATGESRRQLAWLALGVLVVTAVNTLGALLVALGLPLSDSAGALVAALTLPVVPVCIAIATLRHKLYDVELLLRRSLVFSALSAGVLAGYLLLAVALGRSASESGTSALLGGLVALAALPLRSRLQRLLDRRFYGESGDPYGVLTGLARQLSASPAPEEVPAMVARSVCASLRVPWAAVELVDGPVREILGEAGQAPPWPSEPFVLTVHGRQVGRLLVAPRRHNEPLEERDTRLLGDLAGQVAIAVDGLRLTRDLQRSREALVLAREEERRRLRNDLHDGLGPVLAGVLLQLAVARECATDPALTPVLGVAEDRLKGAVSDLRGVVYGLRPAALDELGLDGALREHIASSFAGLALQVSLDLPEDLKGLPAAVEVAAYRVTTEALTNVARHSGALRCEVLIRVDGARLLIEVTDDGLGVIGPPGVGLQSMRERCLELGGDFDVLSTSPAGTVVRAVLPWGPHRG